MKNDDINPELEAMMDGMSEEEKFFAFQKAMNAKAMGAENEDFEELMKKSLDGEMDAPNQQSTAGLEGMKDFYTTDEFNSYCNFRKSIEKYLIDYPDDDSRVKEFLDDIDAGMNPGAPSHDVFIKNLQKLFLKYMGGV